MFYGYWKIKTDGILIRSLNTSVSECSGGGDVGGDGGGNGSQSSGGRDSCGGCGDDGGWNRVEYQFF